MLKVINPNLDFILLSVAMFIGISLVLSVVGGLRNRYKTKNYDTTALVTPEKPSPSPCAAYTLSWLDDGEAIKFRVSEAQSGDILFTSTTLTPQGETALLWGADNNIWYYDTAIGLRYWQPHDGREAWMERTYTNGPDSPCPPRLLLQLYNKLYL